MKRGFFFLLASIFIAGILWAQDSVGPDSADHDPVDQSLVDKASRQRAALRELIEKAERGDAKAQYQLARLYDTGYDTIPQDSVRSWALYHGSAEQGYAPAMNFIGFRYYNSQDGSREIDSALYWIRKAANAGDITAATNLGFLLTQGEGVAHDEEEAAKWLTIASEAGVVDAQKGLLNLMKEKWMALSPDSAFNLGIDYYIGAAPILGAALLEMAANAGVSKAMALMGDAYSKGRGVGYDHQKSIEYFYGAARLGDPSAGFILAELLDIFPDAISSIPSATLSPETPSDSISAQYWYDKAAQAGITDSESAYQFLYSIGGSEESPEK